MQQSSTIKITNSLSQYLVALELHKINRVFDRILIKVLKDSSDPTVLAVAAHDIGQYVRHYGPGKKCVIFCSSFSCALMKSLKVGR